MKSEINSGSEAIMLSRENSWVGRKQQTYPPYPNVIVSP